MINMLAVIIGAMKNNFHASFPIDNPSSPIIPAMPHISPIIVIGPGASSIEKYRAIVPITHKTHQTRVSN